MTIDTGADTVIINSFSSDMDCTLSRLTLPSGEVSFSSLKKTRKGLFAIFNCPEGIFREVLEEHSKGEETAITFCSKGKSDQIW